MNPKTLIAMLCTLMLFISACAPEIGSKEWCDDMKKKPKGDWTANEAADYAKHCLF
jgi:hypothetical protein